MRILLIVFVSIIALVWLMDEPPPPKPEPTMEERIAKAAEDARWRRNVLALRQLKESMKNPKSFELNEAIEMADGTLCIEYRGTNSFNAIVPGKAVITADTIITSDSSLFVKNWNALCAGKSGTSIVHIRRAL